MDSIIHPGAPPKNKVLLLNPPGDEIYIRDYYCSKVSKTTYVYTPVDLLIVSARLRDHASLLAIDAIGERLSEQDVIARIRGFAPNVIVFLTAAVSWETDIQFLRRLRSSYQGRVIGSGDVLMDDPQAMLSQFPELDAVLTDFTTPEIIKFCEGDYGPFEDIVVRDSERRGIGQELAQAGTLETDEEVAHPGAVKSYDIPIPRHDLFPLAKYRYPFIRRRPFATVLTDFGCAFKCTFCIQSTLEYKARSTQNVLEELRHLKKQGIRDLYFSDQTFGYNVVRAEEILKAMIEEKMGFGWVAFYRVDLVREETLELMKEAGCHTLMFGIENASEVLLKEYKKNIKLEMVRKALILCQKVGIRTVGTFILGFPSETAADIEATIRFSLELPLDYVSYNLPVPRSRTELRKQAIQSKIVGNQPLVMDQSGKHTTMGTCHVTAEQLFRYRNRAIRRFYLRPNYLLHRLFSVKTWDELVISLWDGLVLIKESFKGPST